MKPDQNGDYRCRIAERFRYAQNARGGFNDEELWRDRNGQAGDKQEGCENLRKNADLVHQNEADAYQHDEFEEC